jgi:hypothetical protein
VSEAVNIPELVPRPQGTTAPQRDVIATIPFWELYGLVVRHGTRHGSPVRRKAGGVSIIPTMPTRRKSPPPHMHANPLIMLSYAKLCHSLPTTLHTSLYRLTRSPYAQAVEPFLR